MESKGLEEGTFCITTFFLTSVCKGPVILCVAFKTNKFFNEDFIFTSEE